jgi:hypothetical protein
MTSRRCQLSRWQIGLVAIGLAVWTIALRLPLIGNPLDVSPDGCEYIGIARHMVEEGRWFSSIKWHFFTDGPVVHPALADRPPLYPLWAALWIGRGPTVQQIYRVRLANVLLSAAVVAAALVLLAGNFPLPVAAGTALLFATYPAWVRNGAQPLSEPLFLLLMLSAFQAFQVPRPRLFVVGLLTGLACLARPAGVLLLGVFGGEMFLRVLATKGSRGEEEQGSPASAEACEPSIEPSLLSPLSPVSPSPRAFLGLVAGFALVCFPYWLAVWRQYGTPFYSVLSFNFSIGHIYEGTFYGFERQFPSPVEFVREDPGRVVRLIWEQTANLAVTMLRSLRYLWPLALFLRLADLRRHRLLLGFVALNFAFYAMSWVVWGAARYQFPEYLFLAGVLIEAPLRRLSGVGPRRLGPAIAMIAVAASMGACLLGTVRLFREKLAPDAGARLGWAARGAAGWLQAHPTAASPLCAASDPAILNLLTRRPTVVLPRFRDTAQVIRFLDRYHPGALILMADDRADLAVGALLLAAPWSAGRVQPELASRLEPAIVRSRPRGSRLPAPPLGQQSPEQWLVILSTPAGVRRSGGPVPP